MAEKRQRWWFWLHSWLGLKLSLLMGFVLVTGTLAVVSHEIDWLLSPAMRAPTAVQTDDIAWGAAFDAARAARPDLTWLTLERPSGPAFAVQAVGTTSWLEPRRLWLDPSDGTLLGETGWKNAQRLLRLTHRHLLLPTRFGIPLVSSLSLALALSLVSGLLAYRRFWRGFFRRPRWEHSRRVVYGDLHRLLGLWSSAFIAVISVTGFWYLAESLGWDAPALPEARVAAPRADALPPDFDGRRLDEAIAAARRELPGLAVLFVGFPQAADRPLVVRGQLSANLVRERANRVSIDPVTGEVLDRYRGEDLGAHQRIAEAADPLHFGTFGGLATKLLWFVFGILLSALSFTGAGVYATRMVKEAARSRADRPVPVEIPVPAPERLRAAR
jgi:uncharacterized iron-regulated membrane protein